MRVDYDVLVIGGGINGAATARDAAGRGAQVLLIEKDDLASHTSSASTKLIHGGLRYLEHFEFRLVAEALAERQRLISSAPHLIRPLQFVVPYDRQTRPAWMIRLGLFLYDRLGGRRRLPRSKQVELRSSAFGDGLRPRFKRGFAYWDCFGDDSRLVVANAMDAFERGASVLTRTRLVTAKREGGAWLARLEDGRTGERRSVTARILVNATGSWAGTFLSDVLNMPRSIPLRLVRGSHIVTRQLFPREHAFLLQNLDDRVIFVIPYVGGLTLIGTTDVVWNGEPGEAHVDRSEVTYLCDAVNRFVTNEISPDDVIWSYAGLRPLYDDEAKSPEAMSRDYVLHLDGDSGLAPVLSVFGGKITTHRSLAEHALNLLQPHLPGAGPAWTKASTLPGGDIDSGDVDDFTRNLARDAGFLPAATVDRLARSYGSRAYEVLGGARTLDALGEEFGAGLTEAEVDYLVRREWAMTADDILWRRSKLGLFMSAAAATRLSRYLGQARPADQVFERSSVRDSRM
jgi:glycerol-3-phosphate dehydrogenase